MSELTNAAAAWRQAEIERKCRDVKAPLPTVDDAFVAGALWLLNEAEDSFGKQPIRSAVALVAYLKRLCEEEGE